jgi:hypothetical protein
MLGKIHLSELLHVKKGLNEIHDYSVRDLPQGAYFVRVMPTGSEITEPLQTRFVKETQE